MDIRLFKLLILIGAEAVAGALYWVLTRFYHGSHVMELFVHIARYAMFTFPVLVALPEDNWIWLVEEDPRGRKITLRSKASKHLHLSMLYFLLLGYPTFLVAMAMITMRVKYQFLPAWIIIAAGSLFGIYCAFRNYRNVKKYDSLFAVGWDRRAAFVEIFIGSKVAQNVKFFYKGPAIVFGALYFLGAAAAPTIYFKWFAPLSVIKDHKKFLVLLTMFCVMLAFSVWVMAMYVTFQLFLSRPLESWVRQRKNDRRE